MAYDIKGDILEGTIHVSQRKGDVFVEGSDISFKTEDTLYKETEEYVLIMKTYDYAFFESPKLSLFSGNPWIPLRNLEESTMNGEPIPEFFKDTSLEYIEKIIEQVKKGEDEKYTYSFKYSTATDI